MNRDFLRSQPNLLWAQGTVSGVYAPHLPGTVTVSTMAAPLAGDPHGPQYRWKLPVTVVAYGVT